MALLRNLEGITSCKVSQPSDNNLPDVDLGMSSHSFANSNESHVICGVSVFAALATTSLEISVL